MLSIFARISVEVYLAKKSGRATHIARSSVYRCSLPGLAEFNKRSFVRDPATNGCRGDARRYQEHSLVSFLTLESIELALVSGIRGADQNLIVFISGKEASIHDVDRWYGIPKGKIVDRRGVSVPLALITEPI